MADLEHFEAQYKIEIEREEDGRWIAEVPDLPGVMVYGDSEDEAIRHAEALALRTIADRLEHADKPFVPSITFIPLTLV